jgi:hypothetical protein
MSKALAINPDIGLREVLEVSADNNFDIVYSPVLQGPGGSVGGTFIKPSATHAGATTSFSKNGGDPDALPGDASVSQLESFQQQFNQANGTGQSGMCVLKKNSGEMVPVSYRSGLYAEFAGNGEVMDGTEGVSLDRALQKYVQESGNSLMTPTVY